MCVCLAWLFCMPALLPQRFPVPWKGSRTHTPKPKNKDWCTHRRRRIYIYIYIQTHTHTRTRTHTHTHTHIQIDKHKQTRFRTQTHPHTHTHRHTHTHTNRQVDAHTITQTHARTQTLTHIQAIKSLFSVACECHISRCAQQHKETVNPADAGHDTLAHVKPLEDNKDEAGVFLPAPCSCIDPWRTRTP